MGAQLRRGAALNDALAATLAMVADAMAAATRPWWVIGSAAVALHGGATEAADVDVLVDVADVDAIAARTPMRDVEQRDDPLFRSARFLRWEEPPLPVEIMAGFRVRVDDAWRPVRLETQVGVAVRERMVWVPAREELRALLGTFGRPKDAVRAGLLG